MECNGDADVLCKQKVVNFQSSGLAFIQSLSLVLIHDVIITYYAQEKLTSFHAFSCASLIKYKVHNKQLRIKYETVSFFLQKFDFKNVNISK